MGVLQHSNECKQWLLWRNHNIHDVINDLINEVTHSNHVNNSVNKCLLRRNHETHDVISGVILNIATS